MKKVLVTRVVPESCMDWLRSRGYEVIHTMDISEENICCLIKGVDAVLSRELKSTRRILEAADNLKVIARFGVGIDMIDMEYATENGIWVSITPQASLRSVAEHAMALILECAKNIVATNNEVHNDNWLYRNTLMGCDLEGKTLGLVGLGKIAKYVVPMAQAFGMKVIAYTPSLTQDRCPEGVVAMPDLYTMLGQSDFVSLHCPATSANYHLINDEALKAMKKGSFLINTARGMLVDEEALYKALVTGHLRGAAADVSECEPPKPDNPLLTLSNYVLTPHYAAVTDEAMWRMGMHAAWCIDDVLSGNEPRWPANHPENPRNFIK